MSCDPCVGLDRVSGDFERSSSLGSRPSSREMTSRSLSRSGSSSRLKGKLLLFKRQLGHALARFIVIARFNHVFFDTSFVNKKVVVI